MKPLDLIDTAQTLIGARGQPSQAHLRRALSSAYYALFHCLARNGADLLVGGGRAARNQQAWCQVYRALEHGPAKRACTSAQIAHFPAAIENFANTFATFQVKRHDADYDPFVRLTKSAVVQDVATARKVIIEFSDSPVSERRAFCAFVLFKTRA